MAGYIILLLFLLAVAGLLLIDDLVRKVIALNILSSSVVVLFAYLGAREGSMAPILLENVEDIVDPLPQALMLTAIVIGICLTALALALIIRIHGTYGTTSLRSLEEKLKRHGG